MPTCTRYADTRRAFPDQRHEIIQLRHADDSVVAEFWLLGTHRGPLKGLPPTGNSFRRRMNAFFIFEGDRLACERVYFDTLTMLGSCWPVCPRSMSPRW